MTDCPNGDPPWRGRTANAAGEIDDDELPRGEWVRFTEFSDIHRGILAETDLEMGDVSTPDELAPIGGRVAGFAIAMDEPHDLIWTGLKDYVILPRSKWSRVHPEPSPRRLSEGDDE